MHPPKPETKDPVSHNGIDTVSSLRLRVWLDGEPMGQESHTLSEWRTLKRSVLRKES